MYSSTTFFSYLTFLPYLVSPCLDLCCLVFERETSSDCKNDKVDELHMDRSKCRQERNIEIPGCKEVNPQDCHRSFTLALPSLICDDWSTRRRLEDGILGGHNHSPLLPVDSVGTLPLVIGIHCFGCSPSSLDVFLEHADARHAVLVMPHGLKRSFNARHCCGYALEHDIDDLGFLKYVIMVLSDEYSFIQSNVSYATGWSNGGRSSHHFHLFKLVSVYPWINATFDILAT